MTDQPNILVIMTDQQSAHMMSCAGNNWLRKPVNDREWGPMKYNARL